MFALLVFIIGFIVSCVYENYGYEKEDIKTINDTRTTENDSDNIEGEEEKDELNFIVGVDSFEVVNINAEF